LALKALNERLKSVPAGTTWPSMDDDTESSEKDISSPTVGPIDTVTVSNSVDTDTADTPAAVSSVVSETPDQEHV